MEDEVIAFELRCGVDLPAGGKKTTGVCYNYSIH